VWFIKIYRVHKKGVPIMFMRGKTHFDEDGVTALGGG
jgi:hypothetical protein